MTGDLPYTIARSDLIRVTEIVAEGSSNDVRRVVMQVAERTPLVAFGASYVTGPDGVSVGCISRQGFDRCPLSPWGFNGTRWDELMKRHLGVEHSGLAYVEDGW